MLLSAAERGRIDQCVAAFEARTGAQIVAAVVDKSDHYPEIPWKAFALGASMTALALLAGELFRPDWPGTQHTLFALVVALDIGAAIALATTRVQRIARLFLDPARAEVEVLQHARSLFLERELFATRGRNGILVFVSHFERRVVVLPDRALRRTIPASALQGIVAQVTALLADGRVCAGLCAGIDACGALLAGQGVAAAGEAVNELPDAVIEPGDDDAAR